jgi:hypothetical protein
MLSGIGTPVNLALCVTEYPTRPPMEPEEVRTLIRAKLRSGRLPFNSLPRIWGGPSNGEECDACGQYITDPLVIEGIAGTDGSKRAVQMHVGCFALWDEERRNP